MKQIIVDKYGSSVRIKNKLLIIKSDEKTLEISPFKVSKLIISSQVSISGEVVVICKLHSIDLIFLDSYNFPIARIWNNKFGSISTIRKNQLEYFKTEDSFLLIKEWQIEKINTFKRLIKEDRLIDNLNDLIKKMQNIKIEQTLSKFRVEIHSIEALASKIYFRYVNKLLPENYRVNSREKKNSKKKFNSILNYSFGILYNFLEKEIIISGLDPSIGILHINNYGKVPLVYDIIEMYRYICYESLIEMLEKENFSEEDFELTDKYLKLSKNIRKYITIYLNKHLEKEVKNIKKYVKKIALMLLKKYKNDIYTPKN